jgi:glycosyltransferase involved in cell wall biosynthesis
VTVDRTYHERAAAPVRVRDTSDGTQIRANSPRAAHLRAGRVPRVAFLIDCLVAGGAERVAVEVAAALDRTRFDPVVIVTRYGGPLADHLDASGVPYTILGRRRGFAPRKYAAAHRIVRSADLVNAHKLGSNAWGGLLSLTTGTPLVALEPSFSGVSTPMRTITYRWWIGRVARKIMCPSPIVAASLVDIGLPAPLMEVVENGVSLDAAEPRDVARAELGLAPDAFVVGIVARLRTEKAHEVLLRAAARLRDTERRLTVCVVGDGPRRAELQQLAKKLQLDDVVVWAGERNNAKRLTRAFDVGVICSDWEGLPVAALETLAAAVPLVTTAVGTLPDILDGAGVVVPVRDEAALAQAISDLMDDPERARRAGLRGRELVRERFGFEKMVAEFERVFDEVLAQGR